MSAELSGDYIPVPIPDEYQARPQLHQVIENQAELELAKTPMTPWQHRTEHGLCYRDECVARYGVPLLMRTWVQWTPHG